MFAGATAPRTPSFNEADVSDKPPPIRNLPLLTAAQIAAIDQRVPDPAGVAAVPRRGDRADHRHPGRPRRAGEHLHRVHLRQRLPPRPAPVLNGKFEVYEEDIRVPLIIRGPGVQAGGDRGADGGQHRPGPDHGAVGPGDAGPRDGRAVADAAAGPGRRAAELAEGLPGGDLPAPAAGAERRRDQGPADRARGVRGVPVRPPRTVRPPHRSVSAAKHVRDRRPGPHRGTLAAARGIGRLSRGPGEDRERRRQRRLGPAVDGQQPHGHLRPRRDLRPRRFRAAAPGRQRGRPECRRRPWWMAGPSRS